MSTIAGLEGVDPFTVPLPNGTEVTTTVDRPHGSRIVPQGAVGRVVATIPARSGEARRRGRSEAAEQPVPDPGKDGDRHDGRPARDEVEVQIVGVGRLRYARNEVRPRRSGQLAFAVRRAEAERALRPCVVLEATVGSRAWGLADDDSDTDQRGVFVLPFPWTTGLAAPPDVIVSLDGSDTYWEAERCVRRLLEADPNTLETLFVEDITVHDSLGQRLLDSRERFVSAKIYGSFGRYALSQAKKLRQSQRLASHRGLLLDWLRDDAGMSLDRAAIRLASEVLGATSPGSPSSIGAAEILRAKQYIKQLYGSMHDQGLLDASSFDALAIFARTDAAAFDLPRELRPKNAYNLLRLVACAVGWLRTGAPTIRVEGQLRDRLLAIKGGAVPLATAIAWTEAMAAELEDARASTELPAEPDVALAEEILREIRTDAARRYFANAAAPWGPTGPPPPSVRRAGPSGATGRSGAATVEAATDD